MPRIKSIFPKLVLTSFVFSLIIGFFPAQTALATSQFSTGYDISFEFGDNGQAKVTHHITLTNLTKDYFASEYSISTGSDKVANISGSDGLGSMAVTTKTQDGTTVLIAKLNQQVVGQGKAVNFQISYTVDGLARKNGRVWEVAVPQIVTNENLSTYKLSLAIPKTFGSLGKVTPDPDQKNENTNNNIYIFTKNPNAAGVFATFGDYQLFKFTLKYRYKNKNIYPAKASIALPPDTTYQSMVYTSIEPKPIKSYSDDSGNYLADFNIKGGKNLEVTVKGYAKISDQDGLYQTPKTWTKEELQKFTKSDKYIESENSQIQKKAKELAGPKEIYDYVAGTLKYDYSRLQSDKLGRRGALTAFNQPDKSICTDFSDLFVALARAKGIPARGLVGYAYTDNTTLRPTKVEGLVDTTILHAWPEYYDQASGRWIQVDPTWGATTGGINYFSKLDTNHFAFVVNGTSSEEPLPAGAYKTSNNQNDDVVVEFTKDTALTKSDLALSINKTKVISGFPIKAKLTIENKTGSAVFDATAVLKPQGSKLGLLSDETVVLGTILPFEKRVVEIKLRSSSLLDNSTDSLQIKVIGKVGKDPVEKSENSQIKVKPFFSLEPQQIALLIVLLLVIASFLYPYYYRHKNK